MISSRVNLQEIFRALARHYGPVHWWPARTPFEVMVGAILTQNTAWTNVEKAIANLRRQRFLSPRAMHAAENRMLAPLIRSAGYFNQKAKKLKALAAFVVQEYAGSISKMRRANTALMRQQLLSIKGIGPETADSILLYALSKPVFVADAYTKRIFSRHYFFNEDTDYDTVQRYFTDRLPRNAALYNEFHGLIVQAAKDFCRKIPKCAACPLDRYRHRRFPRI